MKQITDTGIKVDQIQSGIKYKIKVNAYISNQNCTDYTEQGFSSLAQQVVETRYQTIGSQGTAGNLTAGATS